MKAAGVPRGPKAQDLMHSVPLSVEIDPSTCDPVRELQLIAVDRSIPATARVAACRILLAYAPKKRAPGDDMTARIDAKTEELRKRRLI